MSPNAAVQNKTLSKVVQIKYMVSPVEGWELEGLPLPTAWQRSSSSSAGRPGGSGTTGWMGGLASRRGRAWNNQEPTENDPTLEKTSVAKQPRCKVKLCLPLKPRAECDPPHLWQQRVQSLPAVDVQNSQPELPPRWDPDSAASKKTHGKHQRFVTTFTCSREAATGSDPNLCCAGCSEHEPDLDHQDQLPESSETCSSAPFQTLWIYLQCVWGRNMSF